MKKNTFILLFMTLITNTFSQNITVSRVNEKRSTIPDSYQNESQIEITISGDEIKKYKFVKFNKITKVIDDQNLSLLKENQFEMLDDNKFEFKEVKDNSTLKFEINNASRKANTIKEIAGELLLYNPTEANGAVTKISNYKTKTFVNLLPADSPVQLIQLNRQAIDKYKNDSKLKREEQINDLPDSDKKWFQEFFKIIDDISNNFNESSQHITFFILGDTSKLLDVYFEDESGNKISKSSMMFLHGLVDCGFYEDLNSKWKLVVNLETASSIKIIDFKLQNIQLP